MQLARTVEPVSRPVVALGPNQGELIWFLNQLVIVKLRGPDAPYGVLETELGAGEATPFHRHTAEDEAFYLLEGEIRLFLEGGRELHARPGSYIHIPRGVAHGFRALTRVRILAITDPMGFVDLTRDYGVEAPSASLPPPAAPDFERLDALARKYHIEVLGPLPEASSPEQF